LELSALRRLKRAAETASGRKVSFASVVAAVVLQATFAQTTASQLTLAVIVAFDETSSSHHNQLICSALGVHHHALVHIVLSDTQVYFNINK
jgi:hypothetical protein